MPSPTRTGTSDAASGERSAIEDAMKRYQTWRTFREQLADLRARHLHHMKHLASKKRAIEAALHDGTKTYTESDIASMNAELTHLTEQSDSEVDRYNTANAELRSEQVDISHSEWIVIRGELARVEQQRFARPPQSPVARARVAKDASHQQLDLYFDFFAQHAIDELHLLSFAEVESLKTLLHFCDFNDTGAVEERDLRQLCRAVFAQKRGITEEEVDLLLLRAEVDSTSVVDQRTLASFFRFHQRFAAVLGAYTSERASAIRLRRSDADARKRAITASWEQRAAIEEAYRRRIAKLPPSTASIADRGKVEVERRGERAKWAVTATVETAEEAILERLRRMPVIPSTARRYQPSPNPAPQPPPPHASPTQTAPPASEAAPQQQSSGTSESQHAKPPSTPRARSTAESSGATEPRRHQSARVRVAPLETIRDSFIMGVLQRFEGPVPASDSAAVAEAQTLFTVISRGQPRATLRHVADLLTLYGGSAVCTHNNARDILTAAGVAGADSSFPNAAVIDFDAFLRHGRGIALAASGVNEFVSMPSTEKDRTVKRKVRDGTPLSFVEAEYQRRKSTRKLMQRAEAHSSKEAMGIELDKSHDKHSSSFRSVGRSNEWRRPAADSDDGEGTAATATAESTVSPPASSSGGRPKPLHRQLRISDKPQHPGVLPLSLPQYNARRGTSPGSKHEALRPHRTPMPVAIPHASTARLPPPSLLDLQRQADRDLLRVLSRLHGI